jgi:hypothetical protein
MTWAVEIRNLIENVLGSHRRIPDGIQDAIIINSGCCFAKGKYHHFLKIIEIQAMYRAEDGEHSCSLKYLRPTIAPRGSKLSQISQRKQSNSWMVSRTYGPLRRVSRAMWGVRAGLT